VATPGKFPCGSSVSAAPRVDRCGVQVMHGCPISGQKRELLTNVNASPFDPADIRPAVVAPVLVAQAIKLSEM
jgi:hypothetical protein